MPGKQNRNGSTDEKERAPANRALERADANPLALPGSLDRARSIAKAGAASVEECKGALYIANGGKKLKLSSINPDDTAAPDKKSAEKELKSLRDKLEEMQSRLYAENLQSLLIVLQAMDGGGKDGTIRHVFEGVNPQGCQVWSFKVPSPEELAHDFLWRCHIKSPTRGVMTIFNRSHYEDVLVVRVNKLVPDDVIHERYRTINDFERSLTLNNTTIVKFFLYISKDEQKKRLQARIDHPDKNWKYNPEDLTQREHWDSYMQAYEDAVNLCSTDYSPWYVVPANKKWSRNLIIMRTIVNTLTAMDPQYPPPVPDLDKVAIE
jgi:PPK2 family polyphosphate:nucleotide phosphotransferase